MLSLTPSMGAKEKSCSYQKIQIAKGWQLAHHRTYDCFKLALHITYDCFKLALSRETDSKRCKEKPIFFTERGEVGWSLAIPMEVTSRNLTKEIMFSKLKFKI